MNIYKQLQEKISNFPNRGTVVVQTDSESLMLKDLFFKAGREIVSDRDVFTLDYELTRHMSQVKGLRILNDQLYPFLFDPGPKRDEIQTALDFIKKFPDPFVEPEIANAILEFLGQEEAAQNLLQTFKNSLLVAADSAQFTSVPRGFANLYLNDLEFDESTFFLSSLLDSMPFGFSDKYASRRIHSSKEGTEWRDQVELYELYKNSEALDFHNFDHQLEEVRFILSVLKRNHKEDKVLVVFPKNKGYEKLFYLYQREFFSEQMFFLYEKEEQTLDRLISKISFEIKSFHTHYDSAIQMNKNKTLVTEVNLSKFNLSELIKNFFEEDFTELDLNVVSEALVQLGPERKLNLSDWKKVFEQEKVKISRKHDNIQTNLNIHDYTYVPPVDPDEVWVLGWSDSLFKKTGDKIFSNSLMSKMEIDLGLYLPSLSKSEAKDLFRNPVMHNEKIKKNITFACQSFLGGSNKAGVFKILMEQKENKTKSVERVLNTKKLCIKHKKEKFTSRNLSASSLQRYEECPYKFYLEKVIGLNKEDEEDYLLSAKQEGSLMHKVLEDLSADNINRDVVNKKVKELTYVEDTDLNTFRIGAVKDLSERMWNILQEEKKHLLESDVVKTISEKFFRFDVDLKNRGFIKEGGDFSLRGLVDRIDVSSDNKVLIYDYKRGEYGTHSLSAYRGSKLAPQLFLYCLAADHGFLGDFKSFVGFQYINLSLYKRQKGFVLKGEADSIAKEIPSRSAVDQLKYEEKIDIFLEKFWNVLERINDGYFEEDPNPSYSGQCLSCTWLGVCKKSETFI